MWSEVRQEGEGKRSTGTTKAIPHRPNGSGLTASGTQTTDGKDRQPDSGRTPRSGEAL